jgi:hypothetical protein
VIGGHVAGRKGKEVERAVGDTLNSRIRAQHELVEKIVGNQTRAERWNREEQRKNHNRSPTTGRA